MGKTTERVALMKKNLYDDFCRGMTLREIEEKYHVSKGYSYKFLDEIAEKHGVDKEMFFQVKHGFHIMLTKDGRIKPNHKVSFEEVKKSLNDVEVLINHVSSSIASLKKDMEETITEMEEYTNETRG